MKSKQKKQTKKKIATKIKQKKSKIVWKKEKITEFIK